MSVLSVLQAVFRVFHFDVIAEETLRRHNLGFPGER